MDKQDRDIRTVPGHGDLSQAEKNQLGAFLDWLLLQEKQSIDSVSGNGSMDEKIKCAEAQKSPLNSGMKEKNRTIDR